MITEAPTILLTEVERSQLRGIEAARDAWREGRADDALLMLETVKASEMSPRIAAECYVAEAAFFAERGEFDASMISLNSAAAFIDSATASVKGAFYHQRARIRNRARDYDAALTDYSGAAVYWEECGQPEKQGAAALNVAHCFLVLGDLGAAHEHLDKALELFRATESFYLSQAFDTLAQIYLAEGKLGPATNAIEDALSTVRNNETWRKDFEGTRDKIRTALLELLGVTTLPDCDRLRLELVERALVISSGSLTGAGKILGVTHHAVASIVDHHKQLEPYRVKRRTRHKPIVKKFT